MPDFTFTIAQRFARPDLCQSDLQQLQGRIDLYWIDVFYQGEDSKYLATVSVDPVRDPSEFDPHRFDLTVQHGGDEWLDLSLVERQACLFEANQWFIQQPEYTQQVEALTAAWARLERPSAVQFQKGVKLIVDAMRTGNQGFSPFVAKALQLMDQYYRKPQKLGHLDMIDAVRQEARNFLVHAPTLLEKCQELPPSGIPEDVQTDLCLWIGYATSYGDALRRIEFARWVLEQVRLGIDLSPVFRVQPRLLSLGKYLDAQDTVETEDKALGNVHVFLLQLFLLLE